MAHPEHRFDSYIEDFKDHQLETLRSYARHSMDDTHLSVEIGSNKGKFLRELAQQYPEKHYIGLEIRAKYAEMAQMSLDEKHIKNARILRADVAYAFPLLFDDAQIDELFILYPDPWWKKRHKKRRVVRQEMLDLFAKKMRKGGIIWTRTDVGTLANDMRAELNAHPDFEPLPITEFPFTPFPYSERDVRTIGKSMPVHLLYYRRV